MRTTLENAIETVYQSISTAFSNRDLDTAASYFSSADSMRKISNGVVLKGRKALRAYWQQRLGQAQRLQITVSNVDIHRIDDDHTWATADETITIDGQTQQAVVSNIFVRTPQGWKILLDHTTYL